MFAFLGLPTTGIEERLPRDHMHSHKGLRSFYPEVIGDVSLVPPAKESDNVALFGDEHVLDSEAQLFGIEQPAHWIPRVPSRTTLNIKPLGVLIPKGLLYHEDTVIPSATLHVCSLFLDLDLQSLPLMGIECGFHSLYRLHRQSRVTGLSVDQGTVLNLQGHEIGTIAGHVQDHAEPSKHWAAEQKGHVPIDNGCLDVDNSSPNLEAHHGRVGRLEDPRGPKPEALVHIQE